MAVRDRLHDLLEQSEPLIKGKVRLLADEGVQRERVLKSLEEDRRSERRVIDERAVGEDPRVLTDLREGLRLALCGSVELRTPFGRGRCRHQIAANARLIALDDSVLCEVLLITLAVVEQLAE